MALTKRAVLERLVSSELRALAGGRVPARVARRRDAIVGVLASARDVKLADIIATLSAKRLGELHEDLGLGKAPPRRAAIAALLGRVRPSKRRARPADPVALIRACFRSIRRLEPVRGCPGYWVADDGRVVSLLRVEPHIMRRLYTGRHRYAFVDLRGSGGSRRISVPRLVLSTFAGPPSPETAVARHLNGGRRDCRIENLAWLPREVLQNDVVQPSRRKRVTDTASSEAIARVRRRFPDVREMHSVPGQPSYVVDDEGNVYSQWSRGVRRIMGLRDPFDTLTLTGPDGSVERRTRSVIVATAFRGPPPSPAHVAVHRDGDRSNFRADNIDWGRRSRSIDKAPPATDDEVRAIRFLAERGESKARIARAFERSLMSVRGITSGRAYRDVPNGDGASVLDALSAARRERVFLETMAGAALRPEERSRREVEAVLRTVGDGARIAQAPGLPAAYFVTDLGQVVSLRGWPLRPPRLLSTRGGSVKIHDGGELRVSVAQLVFEAFLGERPERVRHLDGDPDNNRASNLAWSARAQRKEDSWRPGDERVQACFPDAGELAPIPGAPLYYVSKPGRVYSAIHARAREIRGTDTPHGRVVTLQGFAGERVVRLLSHLVARAFVANPRRHRIVVHCDGDGSNNRAENLAWARAAERHPIAPPTWPESEAIARIRAEFPSAGVIRRLVAVPGYFVDDRGNVYSVLSGTPRRLRGSRGYSVELPGGGPKRVSAPIAQLVASVFLPRPRALNAVVRHKNGDASDNRAENLFWAPRGSGSRGSSRELDADVVRAVRVLAKQGVRYDDLGRALGVTGSMAGMVARRKSYRDVDDRPFDPTRLPDTLRRLFLAARRA